MNALPPIRPHSRRDPRRRFSIVLLCLLVAAPGGAARGAVALSPPQSPAATSWDARAEFSASENPSGAWSYGQTASPSSTQFIPYTQTVVPGPGVSGWWNGSQPIAVANWTSSTVTYHGSVALPPELLCLHPGPTGQRSVARWTAPEAGTYYIAGRFEGSGATTTDVLILRNENASSPLFQSTVWSWNVEPFFVDVDLSAGDTIDFSVGYGGNSYNSDSTFFAASVSLIPAGPTGGEPARVGYWTGEGDANDSAGTNHGTLLNSAGFGAGKIGQAFAFDGIDDHVQAPTAGLPTGSAERTLACWVKMNGWDHNFDSHLAGYGLAGYGLPNQPYGSAFNLGILQGSPFFSPHGGRRVMGPRLTAGAWYHLAATYETGVARLYVNGQQVSQETVPVNTPANTTFSLGWVPNSALRAFNGIVDEVVVYDRALTAAEISVEAVRYALADNCPETANPAQSDEDSDGMRDPCDPDDDNDGYEEDLLLVALWGGEGPANGRFQNPRGVAVDQSGNVYVAEESSRIQKFDASGNFLAVWRLPEWASGGYHTVDVEVDSLGSVYVADQERNRVYKFDSSGTVLAAWDALPDLINIAVDSANNVYAIGVGSTVQKFDSEGALLASWGSWSQVSGALAIEVDGDDNVYVAEQATHRIQKFDSGGNLLKSWGSPGPGTGQLQFPMGLAFDSFDNVYVGEVINNRVQKFDSDGNFMAAWGSNGSEPGQFAGARALAIDRQNNLLYVADYYNNRIQKFLINPGAVTIPDSDGDGIRDSDDNCPNVLSGDTTDTDGDGAGDPCDLDDDGDGHSDADEAIAGADPLDPLSTPDEGSPKFVTAWGTYGGGDGEFYYPTSLGIDASGNVYVGDESPRIQKFDASGAFLASWQGDEWYYGPYHTQGIAIDSLGHVYVADTHLARIQKFDSSGTPLGYLSSQWSTVGVAVDSSRNVYVTGRECVVEKFDSEGNRIGSWGSPGLEDGQFQEPYGIAVDSADNVYVSDFATGRIQKFDSEGNFLTAWGGVGSGPGEFQGLSRVAFDRSNNIYVADYHNHRIQKFDSEGNFVDAWGSHGSAAGQFNYPWAIAIDASNHLYVVDYHNHRIQKFFLGSSDAAPPEASAQLAPAPNATGWHAADVTVTIAASDAGGSGVREIAYSASGAQAIGSTVVGGGSASFAVTAEGETTVTFTATDVAGNASAPQSVVVRIDETAPSLSVPADVTAEATDAAGAAATYEAAAADVGGSGVASFQCSHASGSVFPVGTTSVTCTATDAAGNSAAGAFAVRVVDTTAPSIGCGSPVALLSTGGLATVPDLRGSVAATDAVTPSSAVVLDQSPAPGTTVGIGTTSVTITARDAAGNASSCSVPLAVTWGTFSGFLQPINADGSSIFRINSPVPVKFRLTDASGAYVTTAVAQIYVVQVSNGVTGTEQEALPTGTADAGNTFRYDSSSNQYVFNWGTRGLAQGTWRIRVVLNDGTSHNVMVSLRSR